MYVFQSLFSIDAEKKTLDIGGKIVNIQFLFNIAWGIVKILVILILMFLAVRIGNYIIEKFVHKQIKSEIRFTMDEKKANTVGEVLKSVLRYSVYFIGGIGIFANLFSGVSLTFASIGGVALGFGTQSLVKDIINGFFVLFEDQYAVGDYISIGDNSGIVESIGIRMTQLKDFNGDMHYIPNGTISQVTNHSRGDMSVIVDVEIAYKENIDIAIEVINNACEKVAVEKEHIIEKPKVIGVQSLGVSAVVIRVLGKTEPMYQWALERELRKEIKLTMEREGIERPQGKVEVIKSKE
ncbi:mechanosensitive ion channel family protein [Clostridium paridis]|uniref:Mechanosensitive ion channel family protein n=1 Tax=Clostridium paridis TaxID=2803863 RepID=A0A937FER7_9CLOT|nr:mechanosensitive ion channel family protein [Clostridium paridis]MBL4930502.1 mechanosensitive ion channel family protein [Clostridium paridis]